MTRLLHIPDLFEEKGERAVRFDVCGAPLDDWANGGYVDVSFTCDECGFRSLKSWSCSEGRVWDLVTKSMLDCFREKRCQQGDTLGV